MWYTLVYLMLLGSCSFFQKEVRKNCVQINLKDEPHTLDPRKARDLNSMTIMRMVFEGLTRVDKDEKAHLALTESVSVSPDLKKYTFHLKESQWTNGDPLTADDFIYTWKKVLDPRFPSDSAFQLYVIKNAKAIKEGKLDRELLGARALDKKTLEVELEYPVPYFLELVALPAFFPINARIDQINPHWAQSASSFVCNGPFRLNLWKHHDSITLQKNDAYWDASAVQLSELQLAMIADEETEFKMFEKKELDWAGSPLSNLPVEALSSLKKEQILKKKEMLGTYFIRVNTECFPFHNAQLRKAFALAINRKDIVDHVTQGGQIPATGLVPLSLGLQQKPYFTDAAVQEARLLFSDALSSLHLDRLSFPTITLTYAASERNHLIAQTLQQQWSQAFGISVKLESIERKVYFDRISKHDFQFASGSWIADFNDPINFLDVFRYKKGSSNNTQWENAKYAELLHLSSMTADPQARLNLLKQSEHLLMEEMPILPIFYFTMLYLQQENVHDVLLSPMGIVDFKWANVQREPR